MKERSGFSGRPLATQLAVALVILVVLAVGKTIFIPIALAVLAATLLSPIVGRFEGWIGRPAASLAAVVLMVLLAVAGLAFVGAQVAGLARELPDYSANISRKLGELELRNNSTIARLDSTIREISRRLEEAPLEVPIVRVLPQPDSIGIRLSPFGFVLEGLVTAILVVTLVFFLLLHAQTVHDKIKRLSGRANVASTSGALTRAGERIGRYLLLQSISNVVTGVLIAGALFALGVPHALLFGLLAGILRFVPYVGSTIAAILPTLLAFAVSPGWLLPALTFFSIVGIDLLFGNLVEPIWFGRHLGVSPIVLPLSAMVWAWVWGPIGLILSTPIAVSLHVIGETVPSLGFLDVIFGVGSRLDPHLQLLGRLLSRRKDAAVALAERIEVERGLEALYEQVLAPALVEVEAALSKGQVDAETAHDAVEATRAIIEAAGPFELHPLAIRILVASPKAPGDLCALMACQVLRSHGHDVSCVPADPSADEVVALVGRLRAQVLIVSSSRQTQVEAATELVTKTREDRPRLGIIVIGRGPAESTAHFHDLGCAVARNLATVRYLVPRVAARSMRAVSSRPAERSRRAEQPATSPSRSSSPHGANGGGKQRAVGPQLRGESSMAEAAQAQAAVAPRPDEGGQA